MSDRGHTIPASVQRRGGWWWVSDIGNSVMQKKRRGEWGGMGWDGVLETSLK
jgi:hypothetical protein